jgi:hypothetical protein
MNDRVRLSLDMLYMATENLLLNVDDGDGHAHDIELEELLALAADVKDSIVVYWRTLGFSVLDELEPSV